jgi:hypothetical protein
VVRNSCSNSETDSNRIITGGDGVLIRRNAEQSRELGTCGGFASAPSAIKMEPAATGPPLTRTGAYRQFAQHFSQTANMLPRGLR